MFIYLVIEGMDGNDVDRYRADNMPRLTPAEMDDQKIRIFNYLKANPKIQVGVSKEVLPIRSHLDTYGLQTRKMTAICIEVEEEDIHPAVLEKIQVYSVDSLQKIEKKRGFAPLPEVNLSAIKLDKAEQISSVNNLNVIGEEEMGAAKKLGLGRFTNAKKTIYVVVHSKELPDVFATKKEMDPEAMQRQAFLALQAEKEMTIHDDFEKLQTEILKTQTAIYGGHGSRQIIGLEVNPMGLATLQEGDKNKKLTVHQLMQINPKINSINHTEVTATDLRALEKAAKQREEERPTTTTVTQPGTISDSAPFLNPTGGAEEVKSIGDQLKEGLKESKGSLSFAKRNEINGDLEIIYNTLKIWRLKSKTLPAGIKDMFNIIKPYLNKEVKTQGELKQIKTQADLEALNKALLDVAKAHVRGTKSFLGKVTQNSRAGRIYSEMVREGASPLTALCETCEGKPESKSKPRK